MINRFAATVFVLLHSAPASCHPVVFSKQRSPRKSHGGNCDAYFINTRAYRRTIIIIFFLLLRRMRDNGHDRSRKRVHLRSAETRTGFLPANGRHYIILCSVEVLARAFDKRAITIL